MNVCSSMSSLRLTFLRNVYFALATWDSFSIALVTLSIFVLFTYIRCLGFPARLSLRLGMLLTVLLDRSFACSWLCSFTRSGSALFTVRSFRRPCCSTSSAGASAHPLLLLTSCSRLTRDAPAYFFTWPRAVFVQDSRCLLLLVMVESPPPLHEQLVPCSSLGS